jgi:hypothetical protein
MLPLLVCAAGVLLGLYFNVLVLLPVSLIASTIVIVINVWSGASFYANIGDLLFPIISLQAGYMLGLTGRDTYTQILARLQTIQSYRIYPAFDLIFVLAFTFNFFPFISRPEGDINLFPYRLDPIGSGLRAKKFVWIFVQD